MVYLRSRLDVADNSGARMATMIGVTGKGGAQSAGIGDVITPNRKQIKRSDGSILRFDNNAIVVIDKDLNTRGTRIFGPVARELRERNFMKIVSLASEVL